MIYPAYTTVKRYLSFSLQNIERRADIVLHFSVPKALCISFWLLAMINTYMGYKLVIGYGGVIHYTELLQVKSKKSKTLQEVEIQNNKKAMEVELLREGVVDIDFLDELVHKKLNFSSKNERLILVNGANLSKV